MSWSQGLYDKVNYVKTELKRCLGFWSDKDDDDKNEASNQHESMVVEKKVSNVVDEKTPKTHLKVLLKVTFLPMACLRSFPRSPYLFIENRKLQIFIQTCIEFQRNLS